MNDNAEHGQSTQSGTGDDPQVVVQVEAVQPTPAPPASDQPGDGKVAPVDAPEAGASPWPTAEFAEVVAAFGAPTQQRFSFNQALAALGGGLLRTDGRSARSEYWWGSLILAAIWVPILLMLTWFLETSSIVVVLAAALAMLAFLPLLLAVEGCRAMRRLHDAGHGGWWVLLAPLPFGVAALAWLLARPGQAGANRFGPMSQPGWDAGSVLAS